MATQRDIALYNSRIMEIPLDGVPDEIRATDELEALLQASLGERYNREILVKLAEVQHSYRERMDDLGRAFDVNAIDERQFVERASQMMHAAMAELKDVISREDLERIFDIAVDDPAGLIDEECLRSESEHER